MIMIKSTINSMNLGANFKCSSYCLLVCVDFFESKIVPEQGFRSGTI